MAVLSACSGSDEMTVETPPPVLQQEWTAEITAEQDSITSVYDDTEDGSTNRAAFIGGNTDRFMTAWDQGDVVKVYKGTTHVGDMNPLAAFYGTTTADLTGTLTGPFAVNDVLTLYSPSKSMDFTGQTGTLQSMSGKTFRTQTTTVTAAQNNILSLSAVNMSHRVAYVRFYLTDHDTGQRLHPSRLELHGVNGNAVLTMDETGNVTSAGDLVINTIVSDGEYPGEIFAALLNENDASVTYRIKAIVDGETYIGPVTGQDAYTPGLGKGTLGNCRRKLRKTTAASTLAIESIPDQTFTGYDIEPTLTVKDGDDVLTLDGDYSVDYTSNVNVGEATATITGLADAGDVVATKYLGTKSKAFNIVRATPVIEMSTATMEIVAGHSGQTRAVTRVFIDNNGNGTWDEGTDYDITALCSVTYASDNTGVATVDSSTGAVSPAASPTVPTTATITATVAAATNWNSQSLSYTVNVETEVNTGNGVNPWDNGGTGGGKIYVE